MATLLKLIRFQSALSALLLSGVAFGQDPFAIIGTGPEAKVHAGAGMLYSRGSAANYYNPANAVKTRDRGLSLDLEMDILNLKYEYTYPGYETVILDKTTPVPFFGATYKPGKKFALTMSFLPLPGSSSKSEVFGLPTRKVSADEPLVVNVKQQGKGLGYRASLGGAMRVMSGFEAGLSLLLTSNESQTIATDVISGNKILDETIKTETMQFVLGSRGSFMKGQVTSAFVLFLPSSIKTTGSSTVVPLDVTVSKNSSSNGPLKLGVGFAGRIGDITPFFELVHGFYETMRDDKVEITSGKAKRDVFDTNQVSFGFNYRDGPSRITGAMSFNQSHIGEGLIGDEESGEQELVGMEFQNIDGIPHIIASGGYRYRMKESHIQAGLFYLTGERNVWELGRGYGEYRIRVINLVMGGSLWL